MIRDVRRGEELDALVLTSVDGRALHVLAYGFTPDEARRTREELIRWFAASGIPLVDAGGRRPANAPELVVSRPAPSPSQEGA